MPSSEIYAPNNSTEKIKRPAKIKIKSFKSGGVLEKGGRLVFIIEEWMEG
jgi:hypothetical protein